MNFEHLIQINDLNNPLTETLTRAQIWAGLLHRVEDATPFLPGLERCTVIERHADYLLRDLDFGAAIIRDRVTMAHEQWVRFEIEANAQHAGGSLTISIEEPEAGALFLRFAYATGFAANPNSEDRAYIDYVKSAYQQSDLDCVSIIRTLAAQGSLQ